VGNVNLSFLFLNTTTSIHKSKKKNRASNPMTYCYNLQSLDGTRRFDCRQILPNLSVTVSSPSGPWSKDTYPIPRSGLVCSREQSRLIRRRQGIKTLRYMTVRQTGSRRSNIRQGIRNDI
jgi:hypothetical protein